MLHTKFQFIWESGFRGEDFLEINQSKTRMACDGHVLIGQCLKIFSSETAWPNKPKLVGSIYGRSFIKIAHFVPIR
jgi:hypothetical protein